MLTLVGAAAVGTAALPAMSAEKTPAPKPDGREIFVREWIAKDPRSHGGDGLGPVFNDSSCVACHNQGGVGGAGPASKNVTLATAFSNIQVQQQIQMQQQPDVVGELVRGLFGLPPLDEPGLAPLPERNPKEIAEANKKLAKLQREKLVKFHPAFSQGRSIVIHHFGVSSGYEKWRAAASMGGGQQVFQTFAAPVQALEVAQVEADQVGPAPPLSAPGEPGGDQAAQSNAEMARVQIMQTAQLGSAHLQTQLINVTPQGDIVLAQSQRNTSALFGIGLLDRIPEKAILAQAEAKHAGFPEITGRAARLKNGKIGRFGWKAQEASLRDFVLTACAVEVGLQVDGREQGLDPVKPGPKAAGEDLNAEEVDTLVSYIRDLPNPSQRLGTSDIERDLLKSGREHFAKIGCVACHAGEIGDVKGAYTDLLLHDMGQEMADSGFYGGTLPNSPDDDGQDQPLPSLVQNGLQPGIAGAAPAEEKVDPKTVGALRREWRTPPLWGVRDSSPYMHDGRAATLEQAIAFHGGEASNVTRNYFRLAPEKRQAVVAFLKSLTAPEAGAKE